MNLLGEIEKYKLDTQNVATWQQMNEVVEMVGEICSQQTATNPEESGNNTPQDLDEALPLAASQGKPVDFGELARRMATDRLDDHAMNRLDEALFIFAWNMIEDTSDAEFMAMGHKFVPQWRKHLPQEAYSLLVARIKRHLAALERQSGE